MIIAAPVFLGKPMSSLIAAAARIIDEHGETMTLQRDGHTDLAVKGKRVGGGSTEPTGGTATQQTFDVKLSLTQLQASAWASKVPAATDSIVIDGRTRAILDVRPLRHGADVAAYVLTVAG